MWTSLEQEQQGWLVARQCRRLRLLWDWGWFQEQAWLPQACHWARQQGELAQYHSASGLVNARLVSKDRPNSFPAQRLAVPNVLRDRSLIPLKTFPLVTLFHCNAV